MTGEIIVGKTRVRMRWGRNAGEVGRVLSADPDRDLYYIDFNRMVGTQDGDFPDAYWSKSDGFEIIDRESSLYEKGCSSTATTTTKS